MREFYVEFDLVEFGFATAYYFAKTNEEATALIEDELKVWGGGHADVFEDGDFIFDVEV